MFNNGKHRRAGMNSDMLFHMRRHKRLWARRERKWEIARIQKKVNRTRYREDSHIRLFPKVLGNDYSFTRRYRASAADLQRQFRLIECERVAKKMAEAR